MRYWHGYHSGARWKWFAYGPADATATPSSLAPVKCRMVYPSGAGLHRLSWNKRPLNGWSSCSGREYPVISGTSFFVADAHPVTQPTVSKHCEETSSTNPNQWPGLILSSTTTELLVEQASPLYACSPMLAPIFIGKHTLGNRNAAVCPHRGFSFILCLLRVDTSTQQRGFPAVHLLLVDGRQLQLLIIFVYVSKQYDKLVTLTF